jgi:mono/diheme cytochrome c family protein
MKIFLTVIIMIAILIAAGVAFVYSGVYDVAAIKPEGKFGSWFFSTVMDHSVERHSKGINAPALTDSTMVEAGFRSFSRMCVGCHGAPGVQKGRISKGLNPEPPDLSEGVSDLSDAQIFWITKNGIKMTGMPAFGVGNADDDIWKIVAFVHLLPQMTAEQYQIFKDTQQAPIGEH